MLGESFELIGDLVQLRFDKGIGGKARLFAGFSRLLPYGRRAHHCPINVRLNRDDPVYSFWQMRFWDSQLQLFRG